MSQWRLKKGRYFLVYKQPICPFMICVNPNAKPPATVRFYGFDQQLLVRSAGRSFTVNDEHKLFALYLLHQISSFLLPSYYLQYSHNRLSGRLFHTGRLKV